MPAYPTEKYRGGRPAQNPPQRGRPGIQRPLPRPANSNIRVPVPANDNSPRPPRIPRVPRVPVLPVLFTLLAAADIVDQYVDKRYIRVPPFSGPGALPNQWYAYHGPNNLYDATTLAAPIDTSFSSYAQPNVGGVPQRGPNTGLISGQGVGISHSGMSTAPSATANSFGWWYNPGYGKAQFMRWQRHSSAIGETPQQNVDRQTNQKPFVYIPDPFLVPGYLPAPHPMTVPPGVIIPTPVKSPSPSWDKPKFGSPLDPVAFEPPVVRPMPVFPGKPGTPNGWQYDVQPGQPIRPNPNPGTHVKEPPGPGTKENKSKVTRWIVGIGDAFGLATEINDIINAAWNALPENMRTKVYYRGRVVTGWQDQWADVYRNAGAMNVEQFIRNLIWNNTQDTLIGMQAKLLSRAIPDGVAGIDIVSWAMKGADVEIFQSLDRPDWL